MTAPILTWLLIVSLLAVFFLIHVVLVNHKQHSDVRHAHHFVEFGNEQDEFFLPGDTFEDNENDVNTDD